MQASREPSPSSMVTLGCCNGGHHAMPPPPPPPSLCSSGDTQGSASTWPAMTAREPASSPDEGFRRAGRPPGPQTLDECSTPSSGRRGSRPRTLTSLQTPPRAAHRPSTRRKGPSRLRPCASPLAPCARCVLYHLAAVAPLTIPPASLPASIAIASDTGHKTSVTISPVASIPSIPLLPSVLSVSPVSSSVMTRATRRR